MHLRQFIQSVLGFVFLATSSFALSNTEFTYNAIDGGIEVTGCVDGCPSDLVIPEEIDGYVVTRIGEAAFEDNHLASVVIPDGVTDIGGGAFAYNELSTLVLPYSVNLIGAYAFHSNQLSMVAIPDGISNISAGSFSENQLASVSLPNSVDYIDAAAFRANQLANISIPDGVFYIGESAFADNQLTTLTIPDNVTSIGDFAFYNNQLTDISFSESLLEIGDWAFRLNNLVSIDIPDSVTSIGSKAFAYNQLQEVSYPTKLKSVIEDSPYNYFGNNSGIASADFRYLNLSGVAVITGCTNTCEPNLVIPENIDDFTVLSIDQEAFLDEQIISVTFPDTLTTIGHRAFKNNQLTTLTIPLNVNTVGSLAFENNQITSVNILGDHVTIAVFALRDNPLQEIVSCGYLQLYYNDPAEINNITPTLLDDCTNLSEHSVAIQYATFDIDQSGSVDALSDGLILLRYFFGLRGDSLISGVISPIANRTSAADIEAYIESHMP
jgi:hypothetical protein